MSRLVSFCLGFLSSPTIAVLVNFWYAAGLVVVSVAPKLPKAPSQLTDSGLHTVIYAGHAILLVWLIALYAEPLRASVLAWILSTSTGCVLEIFQGLGGVRQAELRDVLANAAGASGAILVFLTIRAIADVRRFAT